MTLHILAGVGVGAVVVVVALVVLFAVQVSRNGWEQ